MITRDARAISSQKAKAVIQSPANVSPNADPAYVTAAAFSVAE